MEEFDDDEILGRILRRPTVEEPPQRPFKPWHRPRKQWVRRYQWHDSLLRMLRETHFPDDARTVRYLSLPGEDLLDVRVLREACEQAGLDLRFTGLNSVRRGSADDVQLNIAESEVRGLARIHSGSTILRERFESIANQKSLAYAEVHGGGPFHAVNIDLCDHIALRAAGPGRTTVIDALAEVIQLQLTNAIHPWLLFVTTRVVPDRIDAQNLAALIEAILDNVEASDEFARRTGELLRAEGDRLRAVLADPGTLDPRSFMHLFALGFGKWLLRFVGAAHPERTLQMLPGCFYAVVPDHPDMLSLGFRCDVVQAPARDRYRLVGGGTDIAVANEVDHGLRLLEATGELFDLDEMLRRETQLFESLTVESADLLRSAHYEVDGAAGYRGWLEVDAA
ncbi:MULTISPECIES: hypothetical protein [unclassified Mesorhizobium]|uniref:PP_RS20740 family protein n=1 Tax=unclassified Mesorhizobium TaxID=325217 RepID=UPI001127509A|nr:MULTISPECIES: hypothetical protein [unclassified Mesorhizobium]TPK88891.1 hypothetical protein FJ548_11290 [Mesorhizobium sp. B2-4-17]TPL05809.1 hypothetical protein FJ938_14435 [Mesorhizobium sp. B2-4-14]